MKTSAKALMMFLALLALMVPAGQAAETSPVEHLLYSPEAGGMRPLYVAAVFSPNGGMLNLREGQSEESAMMLQLKGGAILQVFDDQAGDWFQVAAGNQMGYVMRAYLYKGEDLEQVRPFTQVMSVQPPRGQSQLPLLELPDDKSRVLAQLDAGQGVIVLGEINNWRILRAGSNTGYVKADYLKMEIDAFGPGIQGERDYNGSRHLERGATVSAVLKEELFDLYTAFVSLDFDPGYTTLSDITAFDLYINHKLIARIPPHQQEGDAAPRVFALEVPFKHMIGAVALVPVNDRGEQMMEEILFLREASD